MTRALLLSTACLLTGAGLACAADPTPQELADQLTGDAAGPESANPQCALFTAEEVARYLGQPVAVGENAGMGMGCQWIALEGDGDAMVTVRPRRLRRASIAGARLPRAAGDRSGGVRGAGTGRLGGRDGHRRQLVRVSVAGPATGEAAVVALLRDAISRRSP